MREPGRLLGKNHADGDKASAERDARVDHTPQRTDEGADGPKAQEAQASDEYDEGEVKPYGARASGRFGCGIEVQGTACPRGLRIRCLYYPGGVDVHPL